MHFRNSKHGFHQRVGEWDRARGSGMRPTDVRRLWLKFPFWVLIGAFFTPMLRAQDLAPRAYVITPVHSNAVILTYAFYKGSVLFDGVKGGPAMEPHEFANWRQKTLLGVSLKVLAPTGQYDPTKLINYGGNRWAFKPEVGLSQRWGHWLLDTYGAAWFFTTNPEFFSRNQYNPGVTAQTEKLVGAFEGHLSYDVKPRFWASLDGNFWFGGQTSLNGVENSSTEQKNSRIGGTVSIPISRHQSLKFSYSNGAYIRYGGNYQNVAMAWQYSWLGRPR
jgi:hypothetical protein